MIRKPGARLSAIVSKPGAHHHVERATPCVTRATDESALRERYVARRAAVVVEGAGHAMLLGAGPTCGSHVLSKDGEPNGTNVEGAHTLGFAARGLVQ